MNPDNQQKATTLPTLMATHPAIQTNTNRLFVLASGLMIAMLFAYTGLSANEATIVDAKISASGDNNFRIDVTISHADEGWDHYANRWDVVADNGTLLGTRVLHHPHVEEQPFTRGISLTIPADVKSVTLIAYDSVHEDNPETFEIAVPGR